ncbi:TRAP transporter small permease [Pikeienuella sp. HZG-20]|uniref:TRAP transporter small permease subunit n=1 Tax=Paludibacillus litoralis TaxID=3133267 RepID=UPI0030ED8E70
MAHRLTGLPKSLDIALSLADKTARVALLMGGALMLISAFMIGADVVLRRVFGISTWGAGELSYYALAISTSWAFSCAMLTKTHIRIAIVTEHLPPPVRAACDLIALLAMGWFAAAACWGIWGLLERSWGRGTTSITALATPIWIPQALWLAGFVFFTLLIALIFFRVLAALFIERSYAVATLHGGAPTAAQETESAIAEGRANLQKDES